MRARIASLLVLLGLAAGFPQTVHAQETGTLIVTDFVDGDRDGVFVPDQDSGEETRACTISVYSFSQEADPPINRESGPVAQSELDASGTATFVLPAASYAVTRSCQPYSQTWRNSKPACCPNLNMEPDARDLDPRNDWEFSAQVVSVRSGETTTAELRYYPDKDTPTLLLILIGVGIMLVVLASLAFVLKSPPTLERRSDPKNPKRYEPKEPDHPPATFDDVFGRDRPNQ